MCSYPVRAGSTCVILTIGFLHNFAHAEKSAARPPEEPALTAEDRAHWAFHAPLRHAVPAVRAADWVRSPIDGFVLAALENANLQPAPAADRVALLRRVTLDLTGLPPLPAETEAFLNDSRPG